MKYFSMFSGIGGFELGIKKGYNNNQYESQKSRQTNSTRRFGITNKQGGSVLPSNETPLCVGFSEIDKYAIQIYKQHFPTHKNYGNATDIVPKELPDFDMLCGGFPCQAFSIAGKRMGFEDTRGTLFFEIARIVKVKRPQVLFLENVKGLLNHDNGRTFATILATLDELGYNAEWQVLNSKHFGVPQNRERVFIIGHLRGTSSRQIFPLENRRKEIIKRGIKKCFGALTANMFKQNWQMPCIKQMNQPKHSNDRVYSEEGLSPSLNTMQGGNRQPFVKTNKIRRLTPVECERLQGFPDNWTEGVSDTQRYKCLGNAVTVNVIEVIMSRFNEISRVKISR